MGSEPKGYFQVNGGPDVGWRWELITDGILMAKGPRRFPTQQEARESLEKSKKAMERVLS